LQMNFELNVCLAKKKKIAMSFGYMCVCVCIFILNNKPNTLSD